MGIGSRRNRSQRSKNAAVALIPAVLLSDEPCVLENVPDISDVSISLQIMSEMGATVEYLTKTTVRISAAGLTNYCVPYESARKMRASYYFLGALLGRYGKARVSMPGGCPLGDRPIDQHLKAFTAWGRRIPWNTARSTSEPTHSQVRMCFLTRFRWALQ